MNRFPRAVYRHGSEPDPRFSMANERTYLAWIRTALAMLAGGIALETLGLDLKPALRLTASILLILTGMTTALGCWRHWAAAERALRTQQPLPSARLSLPIAVVVVAVGALVLLAILWG